MDFDLHLYLDIKPLCYYERARKRQLVSENKRRKVSTYERPGGHPFSRLRYISATHVRLTNGSLSWVATLSAVNGTNTHPSG